MSRLLSLLLAFGAAAPAAAQVPATADICFPEEYSVDRVSYLTAEMDSIVDHEWFSLPQQRVRNDFDLSPDSTVSSYEDYSDQIRYIAIYDGDQETGTVTSCSTTQLNEPLERHCLAFGALYRGDWVVGGVLPAENYVLPSTNNPALIQFDYVVARLGSETVPFRFLARTVQASQSLIQYVNYSFEVDPSVLEVPPECVAAAASTATPGASTASAAARLRDLLGTERVEALSRLPRFRWLAESSAVR